MAGKRNERKVKKAGRRSVSRASDRSRLGWIGQLRDDQRREVYAVLLVGLALLVAYSLYAQQPGYMGGVVRRGLRLAVGDAAVLVPALVGVWAVSTLFVKDRGLIGPRVVGGGLFIVLTSVVLHLGTGSDAVWTTAQSGTGGGYVGAVGAVGLERGFGVTGRTIILYALFLVAAILFTGVSISRFLRALWVAVAAVPLRLPSRKPKSEEEPVVEVPPALPPTVDVPEMEATGPELSAAVEAEVVSVYDPAANESEQPSDPVGLEIGAVDDQENGSFHQISLETESLYQLPPFDLLSRSAPVGSKRGNAAGKKRILEQTLRNFGVEARVMAVEQGPAITRFEVQPGPGVKVSRIAGLADDIALSLAAPGVRIVSPIPGKAALGIEVPNTEVETVLLRQVLESKEFRQSASRLTVTVGQDISGRPIVFSLERMVHLLVAGATGSGKSVYINAMLCSLLYKATPAELRLLLIDPKVVELSAYNGIPHLLSPVLTDPRRAAGALRWLLKEMDRRYEAFANAGVRDMHRFNQVAGSLERSPFPFIVVVIDELADLMMVAPSEVEDAIQRLAQMARAAGIHLVVATQRPSVDVITGVIKANIPSRIAFAVSSQVDSRTILDMAGAEKLLGKGDMLFHPVGVPKPMRVQGPFIPEGDLERTLAYVRRQGQPNYRDEVVAMASAEKKNGPGDDLFPDAVRVVVGTGQASVSIIQRRLRVGYTRAGRLIDMMEERGIVGPHQGPKPREVLISAAEYRRLFEEGTQEQAGE